MKKTLLILSFILLSVVSFAQRQRTTAMFDADTTTRPKTGFYGIGIRSNNIYFVPTTGNNIRLANYSLFTGLTTNYLTKWDGSKFITSNIYEDGTFFSSNVPNFLIGGSFPIIKLNGSQAGSIVYDLRSYIGGVSNGGFEIYDNTNSHTRFTITPTGNVGIGTATPWEKLSIPFNSKLSFGNATYPFSVWESSSGELPVYFDNGYDAVTASTNFRMRTSGTAIDALTILGSGNVGVGTAIPGSKLHVFPVSMLSSLTTGDGLLISNSSLTSAELILGINGSGGNIIQSRAGGAWPLLLNPYGGNVGIGTSTTTSKLQVKDGDIEVETIASGLILKSADGTRWRVTVNNSGVLVVTSI